MTSLAPPPMQHCDSPSPDTSDSEGSSTSKDISVQPTLRDVGKRVRYYSSADKKHKYGTLRFIGETEFSSGIWCGVELNNNSGKNNGTYKGIRYFTCDVNHGVFVPLNKLEMDYGRPRSQPNSTPGSRSSSVDRETKPRAQTTSGSSTHKGLNTLSLQQQIASRLSVPLQKRGKIGQSTSSNNRRQPLKAFATKGVSREEPKETKKLPPFKSGGMIKSRSTDNINKESGGSTKKMPSKKSNSERDLRGIGSKGTSSAKKEKENKMNRKMRVNSCSNLAVSEPVPSKKTPPVVPCPRTSTPGTRDELAPDGCSSPDDSGSNASQIDDVLVAKTPVVGDTAFVETPTPCDPLKHSHVPVLGDTAATKLNADADRKLDTNGLESAPVLLLKNELANPSYHLSSVASPDSIPGNIRYKNRPSGTATLAHPLTVTKGTRGTEETDSVVTQLLDPDYPLEGVSVATVMAVLREQHRLNCSQKEAHTAQLEAIRKEYSDKLERMERQHQASLREIAETHKNEIMALTKAHSEEFKKYR